MAQISDESDSYLFATKERHFLILNHFNRGLRSDFKKVHLCQFPVITFWWVQQQTNQIMMTGNGHLTKVHFFEITS